MDHKSSKELIREAVEESVAMARVAFGQYEQAKTPEKIKTWLLGAGVALILMGGLVPLPPLPNDACGYGWMCPH